jgi:hypothetical protein
MTTTQTQRVNAAAFVACLVALAAGILIALLGIWGVLSNEDELLWRGLATSAVFFFGAIAASLAVRCFRTNETIRCASS